MKRFILIVTIICSSILSLGWLFYGTTPTTQAQELVLRRSLMKHETDGVQTSQSGMGVDLVVEQFVSADIVELGDTLTHTIVVENVGTEDAFDVRLYSIHSRNLDTTPTYQNSFNMFCDRDVVFSYYDCTASWFPSGDVFTLTFTGTVQTVAPVVNVAIVSSLTPDMTEGDNLSQKTTTVVRNDLADKPRFLRADPPYVNLDDAPYLYVWADNVGDQTAVYIPEHTGFLPTLVDNNQIQVELPNDLPSGVYDLAISNTIGIDVEFDAFVVYRDNELSFSRVEPRFGFGDEPTTIQIHGDGFLPEMTVHLDPQPISSRAPEHEEGGFDLQHVHFVDHTLLLATVPAELPEGKYDLTLSYPDGTGVFDTEVYEVVGEGVGDIAAIGHAVFIQPSGGAVAGQPAEVGFRFYRTNGITLTNVPVAIYDDPPNLGGTLINSGTIPMLEPNGSAVYTATWVPNEGGVHYLYGVVDPDNVIPEFDETNNSDTHLVVVRDDDGGTGALMVNGFTINDGARTGTSREIVCNVDAVQARTNAPTADPAYIMYVDHIYDQNVYDWVPVKTSGWMPYNANTTVNFHWHINPTPGTHYVQVWVADEFGNISGDPGEEYITLGRNGSVPITHGQTHLYLMPIEALDIGVRVRLTTLYGDADVYVYNPLGNQIASSFETTRVEAFTFVPEMVGDYHVEVVGAENGRYFFDVNTIVITNVSEPMVRAPQDIEGHVKGGSTPFFGVGSNPSNNPSLPIVPGTGNYQVYLPVIIR